MIRLLKEEITKINDIKQMKDKFLYIKIDKQIEIIEVSSLKVINKVLINIFKNSNLVTNNEITIFDTTFEHVLNYYQTIVKFKKMESVNLLDSNLKNDYIAKKIVNKTAYKIVDILNDEYEEIDCFVFDINQVTQQNKIIKILAKSTINEKVVYI